MLKWFVFALVCTISTGCVRNYARISAPSPGCEALSVAACECASRSTGTQQCASDGSGFGACNCIAVTLTPGSATVSAGASLQFISTLRDDPGGSVIFRLEDEQGGSVSETGAYTAPLNTGVFRLQAVSVSDPSKIAYATITVVTPAVTPKIVTVGPFVTEGGVGYTAQIADPLPGMTYDWALINAAITTSARGTGVTYDAGSLGLLVLTVYAKNSAGETAPPAVSAQQVIAAAARPAILSPTSVTAARSGLQASVAAPEPNVRYDWSAAGPITLGATTGPVISFSTTTTGAATLSVLATNQAGDSIQSVASIDVQDFRLESLAGVRTSNWGSIDGTASEVRLALPTSVDIAADGSLLISEGELPFMLTPFPQAQVNNTVRTISPSLQVQTVLGIPQLPLPVTPTSYVPPLPRLRGPVDATAITAGIIVLDRGCRLVLVPAQGAPSVYSGTEDCASLLVLSGDRHIVTWPSSLRAVSKDPAENLYIASATQLRQISPSGAVSVVAGDAFTPGSGCASDPASSPCFGDVQDIAVHPDGRIFLVDGTSVRVLSSDRTSVTDYVLSPNALHGITLDAVGNIYVSSAITHSIYRLTGTFPAVSMTLVAGADVAPNGHGAIDGDGGSARFYGPTKLAPGPLADSILVTDSGNHVIRLVSAASGPSPIVSTFIGTLLTPGYQDGPRASSRFNAIAGIDYDAMSQTVYIADELNHRIRAYQNERVETFAGTGQAGLVNGAATKARFNRPTDVVLRPSDGLLIVADSQNQNIRGINKSGFVSTLAGTNTPAIGCAMMASNCRPQNGFGTAVVFSDPRALAIDPSSNVIVADRLYGNVGACGGTNKTLLRQLSPAGFVNSLATNGWIASEPAVGGCPNLLVFDDVSGLAADNAGNIIVYDSTEFANVGRITIINPDTTLATLGNAMGSIGSMTCSDVRLTRGGRVRVTEQNGESILYVSDAGVVRRFKHYAEPAACTVEIIAGRLLNDPLSTDFAFGRGVQSGLLPASLSVPYGLAPTPLGDIFVSDRGENILALIRPEL